MAFQSNEGQVKRAKRFTCLADMHHLKYHFFTDDTGRDRRVVEVGSTRQLIFFLDRLEKQVKAVSASKDDPWVKSWRGMNAMSKIAQAIWHSIRSVQELAPHAIVEGRRLNPWLDVGLHVAYEWEPVLGFRTIRDNLLTGSDEVSREGMEQIFRTIREECNSKEFRARVNSHNRGAKESYFRCAKYMLSLLREHGRPLILRIDLYFEGDAKDLSESAAARKAEDKFLRALREQRIVPDVRRYILKREDGLDRRIHYHLLVAMDGDKHRDAYHFGEVVGNYWVNECVGSPALASYFNVWLRRRELEYSCLGHLHHADAHKLEGLRRALWYLCEPGAHVLVREDIGRNLRKGQTPRDGRANALGRPRKLGSSLELAEHILLAPVPAGKERLELPEPLVNQVSVNFETLPD